MIEDPRGHIDYDEQGTGQTILFVPGSWSTRSAWRGVITLLADRFRIVTTSLLGYGNTEERRTAENASIDLEAEIVEAVIGHGRAVHLVGHSYGSVVCLAVALRGAAQLASLTVIEPTNFNLLGVWLHIMETHEHEHAHEAIAHEHAHVHDAHHQHLHGANDPVGEPHSHWHQHARLVHRHPHYPDLHHRHTHSKPAP
jgi:pimeloyl-ACP methyl ester carboxylesterase